MNYADAHKIAEQRAQMLASIAHDVSAPLYEALRKKLEYEQVSLRAIIESDTRADAVKKQLDRTLKSEYFIQKTLDISHI